MGRKARYPLDELCLAQKKSESEPCTNPRRTCDLHCNADLKNPKEWNPNGRCPTTPEGITLRCRMHGGKALIGVANPNFRDGNRSRFSSVLTGTALSRFEDALDNPAHIELREHKALLDMMLTDALERAQLGQTGKLWEELSKLAQDFRAAQRREDGELASRKLTQILGIISKGADAHFAMTEAADLIERTRKVTESERRRITEEQQSITATRALTFAATVFQIVRRNIAGRPDERELLTNISGELAGLVHQDVPGSRELPAAPE